MLLNHKSNVCKCRITEHWRNGVPGLIVTMQGLLFNLHNDSVQSFLKTVKQKKPRKEQRGFNQIMATSNGGKPWLMFLTQRKITGEGKTITWFLA